VELKSLSKLREKYSCERGVKNSVAKQVFSIYKGQNISFELKLTGIGREKVYGNQFQTYLQPKGN
jgi:hypothetical protein